jgi:hypothetical protein
MQSNSARWLLIAIELIVGLGAVAGGVGLIAGGIKMPIEWLAGTPFRSYLMPGLLLFFAVGGGNLAAAYTILAHCHSARRAAQFAGGILTIWMITQIAMIGYVSWMQPLFIIFGLATLLLSFAVERR